MNSMKLKNNLKIFAVTIASKNIVLNFFSVFTILKFEISQFRSNFGCAELCEQDCATTFV